MDAPRYGTVVGNVIDTVFHGALDEQTTYGGGDGVILTGWPSYPAVAAPARDVAQIILSSNFIKNCARGGVNIRGEKNITIDGNMFVDIGDALLLDGTTAIAANDVSLNNGIYSGSPATVENLAIRNNDFIDTRTTAVMNYAVIPQLLGLASTVVQGNVVRGLSQGLAEAFAADRVTATGRVVVGDGRINFSQDTSSGSLLAERRDVVSGSRLSIPLQINATTGSVRTNDLLNMVGGAYLPAGKKLDFNTATGGTKRVAPSEVIHPRLASSGQPQQPNQSSHIQGTESQRIVLASAQHYPAWGW